MEDIFNHIFVQDGNIAEALSDMENVVVRDRSECISGYIFSYADIPMS